MKSLSDNLMVLVLAVVLGLSPLQNIAASVSGCVGMNNTMHPQMNLSHKDMHSDLSQTDNKNDRCNKNSCDVSPCASGAMTVIISSGDVDDLTYTVTNIYFKPVASLIPYYPSSLYRPPKFNSSLLA